jgi:hypothetical protein
MENTGFSLLAKKNTGFPLLAKAILYNEYSLILMILISSGSLSRASAPPLKQDNYSS